MVTNSFVFLSKTFPRYHRIRIQLRYVQIAVKKTFSQKYLLGRCIIFSIWIWEFEANYDVRKSGHKICHVNLRLYKLKASANFLKTLHFKAAT